GMLESVRQSLRAVLKRMSKRIRARCETPLIERHQEADGARSRIIASCCRSFALASDKFCYFVVELELGTIDSERDGARDAAGEHLARGPCAIRLPLGEVDHRFLRSAQIEGCMSTIHCLTNGSNIRIGVLIEQLQKQRKIFWVTFVRRRRKQEDMI